MSPLVLSFSGCIQDQDRTTIHEAMEQQVRMQMHRVGVGTSWAYVCLLFYFTSLSLSLFADPIRRKGA